MRQSTLAAQSRSVLDARFKEIGRDSRFNTPVHGWIKAVRTALGMSTSQLAQRLGIKQPSVIALEQSELRETIELATLRRVAEALDCQLVYALVPKKPLETTIREQARAYAHRRIEPIRHSMLIEDQQVGVTQSADDKDELDAIIRETNPRLFWN